jgi:hypothetical protein
MLTLTGHSSNVWLVAWSPSYCGLVDVQNRPIFLRLMLFILAAFLECQSAAGVAGRSLRTLFHTGTCIM